MAAVAAIGLADDLWSGSERGFRAHLDRGRTTGVLKLLGIPMVGLLATRRVSGALLVGLAANFLKLVAAQRRLFAVREMARAYRALADEARGVKRAEVTLAQAPSERNLASIREALREVAGADVALDVRIDPSIIGGLRVKLGSRMVDASLKTKLQGIRVAMRDARQ